MFSPNVSWRSLHHPVHSVVSSLLPRSACHSSTLEIVMHFYNLRVWAPNAVWKKKKTGTLSNSRSPVHGLERLSSCANSVLNFLNPSFFLFCLSTERVVSPLPHCLPQFTPMHIAPAKLSPSNCGDPSATLQIYFLGVPSDLTSICLRDEESPGSSYFSSILIPLTPLMHFKFGFCYW